MLASFLQGLALLFAVALISQDYRDLEKNTPLEKLTGYPNYKSVGKFKGLFQDGKAAPWDLHIIDFWSYPSSSGIQANTTN